VGLRDRDAGAFVPVRLTLGRFLALGLEFQPASDVLRTAVAPSFRELGQLAAIRTALNYFLAREQAPASAAAILVLRRLIGFGLRTGGRTWASTRPDRPSRLPDLRRLVRPAWRA
jgi:hypothetical protein